MPIITPIDEIGRKRGWAKWQQLYPLQYIGVCRRGCHGQQANTYDDAIKAAQIAQAQCDEEQDDCSE